MRSPLRFVPLLMLVSAVVGCGNGPDRLDDELRAIIGSSRYVLYVVKAGDTLWSVAKKFGTSVADLIALNRMNSTDDLEVGQELKLPSSAETSAPVPVSERGWMWPVRGKPVVKFGQLKDGLKSWGMDVRTGPGAPVVASRGGLVRKAGPFVGLGNTVVIVHDTGNMITLCGKIGTLLVKEGDVVKKGQKLGTTPESYDKEPIIHIRMFKKGRPVDPAEYLP
ncbi:peptidoglycan DD-metalloendopeptidase family protein [Planctomycetota bacterium]